MRAKNTLVIEFVKELECRYFDRFLAECASRSTIPELMIYAGYRPSIVEGIVEGIGWKVSPEQG